MVGNDAFNVIWMAKSMNEGWYDAWTLKFASNFGLFPFSFYPIGVVFFLSILLKIGFSIDITVYIFSLFFMVIGIIGSYLVGNLIFENNSKMKYGYVLFFSLSPIFLDFTYWTCSVRGPFLAILKRWLTI
ncbi:hypothetical protein ES705_09828 [subsurface metagenome]